MVFGDSNTWAFGPAWVKTLVAMGWPADQVIMIYRSGTTPRHWLPRSHRLYQPKYGVMLDRKERGQPSVYDALSPATRLVIIGLGGNMKPGTRDDASATLGPWASFVHARDAKHSHVPRDTAADFVAIVAKRGALKTPTRSLCLPLRATVVDADALLRQGGPRFRPIRGSKLTQGDVVLLETWAGRHGRVLDARTNEPLGWTVRSNLEIAVG